MRKSKAIIVLLFMQISCNTTTQKSDADNTIKEVESLAQKNFDWLLGKWEQTDEDPGKETFEEWSKPNDSEYRGFGYTLQRGDTIWQEEMLLIPSAENWFLKIKSPDDPEAVTFTLKEYSPYTFSFENAEVSFPNLITYRKQGEILQAAVSGGDTEIRFAFRPVKE
ncbi:DUF6265 family protein [Leeuwenhoekiella parthenopeia]|uniref:DUF6265 family protein n=1 Tax=Leeuwenhoekiella parthenopeia TaxID=2890320 RepID=A0ABS8GPX2_9FLAO|nr:DUF6265 family protein [Leeuwenhoekiella parthenopeia]MCC4212025.1 DUF6265 family protein [Leeuwenhoekiella parthenopeia]